jgi:hypothetical protein
MSLLVCPHECECNCHHDVVKRYGMEKEEATAETLFKMPEILHFRPCCDGPCPACQRPIRTDMTKQHLMSTCHGKTEAEADELLRVRFPSDDLTAL